MYLYLFINLAVFLIPFLFSFDSKVAFYTRWKYAFPAIVLGSFPFIVWDIWFAHRGFWGFTSDYLIGISLFGLPLEELLFFLAIPYSGIFTWEVINYYFRFQFYDSNLCKAICFLLILIAFLFLASNKGGIYSVFTFSSVLLLLALVLGVRRLHPFMLKFLRFYIVLSVPFMWVNGILTGMFLEKPIVWYKDAAIIGLRIITIPIEDFFFGLALMWVILSIYEGLQNRLLSDEVF